MGGQRAFGWFAAVTAAAALVHPFLPASARPLSFTLVSAATLPPIWLRLRRDPHNAGPHWALLLAAMTVLTVSDGLTALGGDSFRGAADLGVTVGHALLLSAAVGLVLRRGRNDIGGLIDASVTLMGVGSLLWTTLLQPHLTAMHAPLGTQIALLVSIFVLTGILGALGRLWFTASERLVSLQLFVGALLLALVGNTALAVTTGSMTTDRPRWVEEAFLIAYLCVGAAALHPSATALSRPGTAPIDRLSAGRLVFLGAAIVVNPVLGGGRQIVGLPVDGLLIALGTLTVAPLVMVRVHRLARERERAERALAHQATHDTLTGLPNRGELLTRLTAALAVSSRVALLFCDLNGFKAVNDRLGHTAGDQLLVEVGRRLTAGLRAGDTVARYGGDEFLLLCEDAAGPETVARLCAHVRESLAAPFVLAGEGVRIGASVGAVVSSATSTADELISQADEAMYRVKHPRAELAAS